MKINRKNDAAVAIVEKTLTAFFRDLITKTMLNANKIKNSAPKIKEKINL